MMTPEEIKLIEMGDKIARLEREIERLSSIIAAGDKVLAGRQKRVLALATDLGGERRENLRLASEIVALKNLIKSINTNINCALEAVEKL